jgi:hypothetical protein
LDFKCPVEIPRFQVEGRTVLAMTADMGRGTTDDAKTWHQYVTLRARWVDVKSSLGGR